MWRSYVICVLLGLLIVSVGGSLILIRQVGSVQSDTDRLRQRLSAAEDTQNSLQQQIDQIKSGGVASATPGGVAPASSSVAPVPTIASAPQLTAALQQIEDQVSGLRGLQPKASVPVRFFDPPALQQYFVDRFNQDYLPNERESDQKLLATLGLLNPGDDVVQILLDVLQEQVIGVYSQDDRVMNLVTDNGQFGAQEKTTFAREYEHALQDQYYDLSALVPKHPDNDDKSLAMQALTEGDAMLVQRLWSQQFMTQDEINQLDQGGADSKLFSAPAFLRDQLLFPYSDGFNFVRQIYQAGGMAALDDVFRNPPDSTEQILHIDKYRSHEKPISVDLPDLSQGSLGAGWRQINSNIFGELDLRLMLSQFTDSTRGVRAASGWGGDRWELLEKGGRQALVIKTVWDTDANARTFFDTFGLAMNNRFVGAQQDEASSTRQALTTTTAATDVRRSGSSVLVVISFDRPSADAIVAALGGG